MASEPTNTPPPAASPSTPAPAVPSQPPTLSSTSTASSGSAPTASAGSTPAAGNAKPPLEPLTGFRSALEHTGLPRSVITYKPKLPSRNWLIFWSVLGTVSYLYYNDRKQCNEIKARTIERVKYRANEPIAGSLDLVRKVKVVGAKWCGDDDEDRALRYFRKYVKPYLVAAGMDYEQVPAPLHGSIARQIHAQILSKRRRALGLETAPTLSLPGMLDPAEAERREVEGGVVVVGRASLKEYLEGLKRGWTGDVNEWDWEKEVEGKLKYDGVFEDPPASAPEGDAAATTTPPPAPSQPASPLPGTFSFLSRPPPQAIPAPGSQGAQQQPQAIPPQFHIPPSPLPPLPPMLLLPFTSHLGFKQIPWMIYDFFTERYRVKAGSDAALALIENHIRPFDPSDREFDEQSEKWYKKDAKQLPEKIAEARKTYYEELREKIQDVRDLRDGKRELSDEEKKSTKPLTTEEELKEQRGKKELRWMGQEEGWEIVRPEAEVPWDERFNGLLKVYELPKEGDKDGSSKV